MAALRPPAYVAPPVPTTSATAPRVSPLLPLALLEAVRELDAHVPDELDEVHEELAVKRLGQSPTVAAQIARWSRLARKGEDVDAADCEGLLRLVARRADAGLVFTDAGRRLGRHIVSGSVVPRALVRLMGWRVARRRIAMHLRVVMAGTARQPEASGRDTIAIRATPDGAACAFLGAAVAEVLRRLTAFDGAMMHVSCLGRGGDVCRWRAALPPEES